MAGISVKNTAIEADRAIAMIILIGGVLFKNSFSNLSRIGLSLLVAFSIDS